jgi:septal ring factor EnvC (AmiA/AmiB activator)
MNPSDEEILEFYRNRSSGISIISTVRNFLAQAAPGDAKLLARAEKAEEEMRGWRVRAEVSEQTFDRLERRVKVLEARLATSHEFSDGLEKQLGTAERRIADLEAQLAAKPEPEKWLPKDGERVRAVIEGTIVAQAGVPASQFKISYGDGQET